MKPVSVVLEDHTAGDSWQGIPTIGPITNNGVPMPFPIARVQMTISKGNIHSTTSSGRLKPSLYLDSQAPEEGETITKYPITIVDAETWEISIPRVPKEGFQVSPGYYVGALRITDSDGMVITTHEIGFEVNRDLNALPNE